MAVQIQLSYSYLKLASIGLLEMLISYYSSFFDCLCKTSIIMAKIPVIAPMDTS
ncbi:MAG: hypothetical protein ACFFD4_40755 [Candidatus Odinarchaeota archaeon]